MKRLLSLLLAALFAGQVAAVTPEEDEGKKVCIKPKFRDFVPAPKAEVPPESLVSFHVSKGAEGASITVTAKGEKLDAKVDNRNTFFLVTAKLPAHLRNDFARIHVEAKAAEGGCLGHDGWLIKITDGMAVVPAQTPVVGAEAVH